MASLSRKLNFTVGFVGNRALVDRKLFQRLRHASAQELLEAGLLAPACRLAHQQNDVAVQRQIARLLQLQGNDQQLPELLGRVFGITSSLAKVTAIVEL